MGPESKQRKSFHRATKAKNQRPGAPILKTRLTDRMDAAENPRA